MYRVSPATYLVGGVMSASLANSEVVCDPRELLRLQAPSESMTCGDFLGPYASVAGGRLWNPEESGSVCLYCPITNTNQFLARFEIDYADRWRNFGLLWVYIIFNVITAMGLYWLVRVPKRQGVLKAKP